MLHRSIILTLSLVLISLLALNGCARPKGESPAEKRNFALNMKDQTLNELYAKRPQARSQIKNSAGYAVFSNISTQLLYLGSGNGYGVAVDNSNGRKTYMRMAQATAGLGVAIKDFREVIIFNNRSDFRNFVIQGWELGVQAGAGAKKDEQGVSETRGISVTGDIITYYLTEQGVELRTNVAGKKYWQDNDLNYR